jgi:hypothetical protein
VQGVGASDIDATEGITSGDGIVITGNDGEHNYDPAMFQGRVVDNEISGAERAGIVFEHVAGEFSGNALSDNGLTTSAGVSAFSQDDATVTGDDEVELLVEGGEIEPLEFY